MRSSKDIIRRDYFGAIAIRVALPFISFLLISAMSLNAQVVAPGNRTPPQALLTGRPVGRIVPLLAQLADQASLSADTTVAVRAQSQAASLLFAYDREQARAIYRRVFQSLVSSNRASPANSLVQSSPHSPVGAIAKQYLLPELLQEIAGQDPGLAEELARDFTTCVALADPGCASATISGSRQDGSGLAFTSSPGDVTPQTAAQCSDLLVGVALQMVERDPTRAMALAKLSLAFGVSRHFSQLLISLAAVNSERATLLFSFAVGCLERSKSLELEGIHTLGAFLVSSTDYTAREFVNEDLVVRFLSCVLAQLSQAGHIGADGTKKGFDINTIRDGDALVYFIGRQLGDLFALYLPEKVAQFKCKIAELSCASKTESSIAPAPAYASNPNEIVGYAQGAVTASNRDLMYARAAFAWLARGELSRARTAAAEVCASAMHDRVMIQVGRRYSAAGQPAAAFDVALDIEDPVIRANLLTNVAGAALASKQWDQASYLLEQALASALAAPPSITAVVALIGIAESFTKFSATEAFKVMQTAVQAINQLLSQRAGMESTQPNPVTGGESEMAELYGSAFEVTFAALGRADFELAWTLARQLTANSVSVIAQLAVCRGGLVRPRSLASGLDQDIEGGIRFHLTLRSEANAL